MHLHLYMDESGSFEGIDPEDYRDSLILGVLVPDEDLEPLKREYKKLASDAGLGDFHLRGSEQREKGKYKGFLEHLVELTLRSNIKPFVMRFSRDFRSNLDDRLQEHFAANRYFMMAQSLLEHLLFLCPEFWGNELTFSLHPNSRHFPVPKADTKYLKDLRSLGFNYFVPDPKEEDALVKVWTVESLRILLHHLQLQYEPWVETIGQRSWSMIEMPVAKRSEDPLVFWVDNLANLLLKRRNPQAADSLEKSLLIEAWYGLEEMIYRNWVHLFLAHKIPDFLDQALSNGHTLSKPYYVRSLDFLVNKASSLLGTLNDVELYRLERAADRYLRQSRGNWGMVMDLLNHLLDGVKSMPPERQARPEIQRLLGRLYSHKLSCHNHRGEVRSAWEAAEEYGKLDFGKISIEDWREHVGMRNRQAVSAANLFHFEWGNEQIEPLVRTLDRCQELIARECSDGVSDPLMGKLRGTMGQNLAFLAPRHPDLYPEAEKIFLDARNELVQPRDQVRQDINLTHLYMDWNQTEKAAEAWNRVLNLSDFGAFVENPTPETARYKQFVLSLLLKRAMHRGEVPNYANMIEAFPLLKLREWFGSAFDEHPFELICGYLGRMAIALDKKEEAEGYFSHALKIPPLGKHREQPTLQVIRGQIMTWQALGLLSKDHAKAAKLMEGVKDLLREIGEDPQLAPILQLEGDRATGGWFREAWEALDQADWTQNFDESACNAFLSCFTFNYH